MRGPGRKKTVNLYLHEPIFPTLTAFDGMRGTIPGSCAPAAWILARTPR